MKILAMEIAFFGVIILLMTLVFYFIGRANYKKFLPKLDEFTRNAWAISLRRFVVLGASAAALAFIVSIFLYLLSPSGNSGVFPQIRIVFPIILIVMTALIGGGVYIFMTFKLQEHQVNGNEQYAKDVAVIRTRVASLFLFFLAMEVISLISDFSH